MDQTPRRAARASLPALGGKARPRTLIVGPTCFSATRGVPTSVERATGGTVGLECGGRVMRFVAAGGRISTTILMRLR
jgi:hypothetical protein